MIKRLFQLLFKKMVEGKFFQSIFKLIRKIITKIIILIIKILSKIFKYCDAIIAILSKYFVSLCTPIDKNKIMFLTYQGNYTCNPKGICDEIIRQKLPFRLIWTVLKSGSSGIYPLELVFVKRGSYFFYREAASAKVIIDNTNTLQRLGVHKKRGQYWLQTWHGSLGIKKLDGNIVMNRHWKKIGRKCQKQTDFLISNSEFETNVFHTSYWKGVPVLLYGHARNDILFLKDEEKIEQIRSRIFKKLGIEKGKKIFLFAPTHMDNVNESLIGIKYELLKDALIKRFGGEWQILVRLHSRLRGKSRIWLKNVPQFVSDATLYDDMQELMLVTDVGLTDYSSWIFDFIFLKRPAFILAENINLYEKQRGFYYPLESTPFPVAYSNEELAQNIIEFDNEKYISDVDIFLKDKGCIEDGNASKRIVEKIKELMKS